MKQEEEVEKWGVLEKREEVKTEVQCNAGTLPYQYHGVVVVEREREVKDQREREKFEKTRHVERDPTIREKREIIQREVRQIQRLLCEKERKVRARE